MAAHRPRVRPRDLGGRCAGPACPRLGRRQRCAHPRGREEHDEIERLTDRAAARPWAALGADRTAELAALLAPMASAVLAAGDVPAHGPVGLVRDAR
ncbi:hypothetical protein [Pseudonocardia sp. EV170527-09]|uniref:helix-turn-helix domain-containing protein n=1 Tax=Pseudonocardia sp. EV170527-09 TaxID=2603411 RepID=UPI001F008EB7|nr:hypothetical protein [Pseudonocardia sp. EV170527-09]